MDNEHINVSIIPLDIVRASPERNLNAVASLMGHVPEGTDIVALPELFTTGVISDMPLLSEMADHSGRTLGTIADISKKYGCAICGSVIASEHGHIFNRAFFHDPDSGTTTFYDKRHLFSLSSEYKYLSAGTAVPPIIPFRGWNISMIVCYDLRFPVWCRSVNYSYDIMIVPANWPQSRGYAWQQLLIARAIENQSCWVGADRSGSDDYGKYDGLADIYNAMGMPIGVKDKVSGVVSATIDRRHISEYRRRLPTGNDMDDFKIIDTGL